MTSDTVEFSIAQVLPHDGRMLLLEELLEHSDDGVVTAVTIRPDSVLCDGVHGVPTWVGMEYMAQAACAYSGVYEVRAGRQPRIGLLLGTRSYQTQVATFPLGARLMVSAQLVMRDDNDLAVFHCRIHHGDVELAKGDIKAIRPRDIHALVREQTHG
jgi:predicted hotdog family 3-hydroxylacyl-ACP dehydratase